MYRLLSHPEHIEPLRQEVEAVVAEEGWTKAGMDKMHKIDSFLRETQRLDGLGNSSLASFHIVPITSHSYMPSFSPVVMARLVLRPFTFSNGVTIPAGTLVSIPSRAAHTDERIFENPDEFDGFRFAKLRKSGGDIAGSRSQVLTLSSENLTFGLGRHAW